jgi:hypothetical protein
MAFIELKYRTLPRHEWRRRAASHAERLRPHCHARTARTHAHQSHPIDDFLFDYYGLPPARLLRWSPGPDVLLEDATPEDVGWGRLFTRADGGVVLPASSFPPRRRAFARWALDYLRAVADRPPALGCFGLHEWAMVYQSTDVRHDRTPLRLSPADIEDVVEASDLRCTHFDAYRFFTPAAAPRNRFPLSRQATEQFDQPGCVHVTMDLYKYAFKLGPWCPAELVADAFNLAWDARQTDMRASPYDLRHFGLAPIPIETRAGRDEYASAQKGLADRATPLRRRLIGVYECLWAAVSRA